MLRTAKPKNARSKRALDKRASKIIENGKRALFVPGSTCNKFLHDLMVDLEALKKPDSVRFQRKNEIRPFEDSSSLEFFSEKNDTSLIVVGTHSKKRPNCLTFCRMFNYQLFDMIELKVVSAKLIQDFHKRTFDVGMKPLLVFNGALFDEDPVYKHIKSLFLDFFRGQEQSLLDPSALQHVITITAEDPDPKQKNLDDENKAKSLIRFRCYLLKTETSTTPKQPRVELDEIGPRIDFAVGREQIPNPDMEKQAYKVARQVEKTKKNVEMDFMGDKLGRIHVGKQDLNELQTRKMKGLKRKYDVIDEEKAEQQDDVEYDEIDEADEAYELDGDSFTEFE
ncbi:rRNA-binding ribosome biosynthesis protein [Starmerella bacillaris]|uniref:Ribosome production factor 2 homolog n=1 Tax=Starmerella bacillaris TaxID=1247836 RepID=A0AAV5RD92_STABA|nr:rRNA-binding ribosome biosynthesis protein [Starmerella bacillaris]